MENIVLIRLNERAKELKCLYEVLELLSDPNQHISFIFRRLIKIIPPAWQYPSVCQVRIIYENEIYKSEDYIETEWKQSSEMIVDDKTYGSIEVSYQQFIKDHGDSQFLPEEQKLLNTIAFKISAFIFARKLKNSLDVLRSKNEFEKLSSSEILSTDQDFHWKWRYKMVEQLCKGLDKDLLGIVKVYLIGSTKNAEAGPKSDIDLLVHFNGNSTQRQLLELYVKGWSLCLSEYNHEKTGYIIQEGMIDLHIITDEDIKNKTSYAVMIGSHFNSAREIY